MNLGLLKMNIAISLPIGVIVARERSSDLWQEFRWRPVRVFMNAPEAVSWREVERGRDVVHYHAATLPLVLSEREKIAYRVNLANGVPSVYVTLRETIKSGKPSSAMPVGVAHITASPFEIQAVGQDFDAGVTDFVERVPMPEELVQVLQSFVNDSRPPLAILSDLEVGIGANIGKVGNVDIAESSSVPAKRGRTLPWFGDFARMKFSV